MRVVFDQDELHRLWVSVPELSDFHLEFDISAKRGFRRSDLAIRQEPMFDLNKISDLVFHGLTLDAHGFTLFNKQAFEPSHNPNIFVVHFDLPGKNVLLRNMTFGYLDNAEILIEYRDEAEQPLPEFENEIQERSKRFEEKFQQTFFGGGERKVCIGLFQFRTGV